jgi:hypothetical protein
MEACRRPLVLEHETPFGLMNQESTKAPIGAAGSPGVVLPTAEQMQALADQLKTLVKADKTLVYLSPGASDQITLTNTSAGLMNVSVQGAIPGGCPHRSPGPKAARECGTRPEGAGWGKIRIRPTG